MAHSLLNCSLCECRLALGAGWQVPVCDGEQGQAAEEIDTLRSQEGVMTDRQEGEQRGMSSQAEGQGWVGRKMAEQQVRMDSHKEKRRSGRRMVQERVWADSRAEGQSVMSDGPISEPQTVPQQSVTSDGLAISEPQPVPHQGVMSDGPISEPLPQQSGMSGGPVMGAEEGVCASSKVAADLSLDTLVANKAGFGTQLLTALALQVGVIHAMQRH